MHPIVDALEANEKAMEKRKVKTTEKMATSIYVGPL